MLVMKVRPITREEYMRNMTNLSVLAIHDKLVNLYCLLFWMLKMTNEVYTRNKKGESIQNIHEKTN